MSRDGLSNYLVDELKLDKDCMIGKEWLKGYVRTIVQICWSYGVKVNCIKKCNSKKKGFHLYISINPVIEPKLANYLQFLLGDDARRVAFNQARINSGLVEFNKLFEEEGTRLRTIYRD